ncbi:MAG: hypothetical protein RR956_06150, partial [Christensenella sp.]
MTVTFHINNTRTYLQKLKLFCIPCNKTFPLRVIRVKALNVSAQSAAGLKVTRVEPTRFSLAACPHCFVIL